MFALRVLQAARSSIPINKRCFSAAITSRQKLVDLSRELYHRSPGHPFHPPMVMAQWDTHQEMKAGNTIFRTASYFVSFSDHAGTHVDAPKHFSAEPGAKSIDELPLETFYTVLLYMAYNKRVHFDDPRWQHVFPGLALESVHWLADKGCKVFGVEAVSPAPEGELNFQAHNACAERGITHIEGLDNVESVVGKGRFKFIGFPLKLRGGSGGPMRAVAVLNE